jgi:dephospho-CoA kinase
MLIIGISGQTGAGKSTFADLLSQRGLGENLEVDAIGHELLVDEAVRAALVEIFGSEILDEAGEICRRSLGRKAFVNNEATLA